MEALNRVFVGGIPVRVDKQTIIDFFSQFGKIKYCKIKKNSKTGRSLGYVYLTFEEAESIKTLVNRQIEFCSRICECKQVLQKANLRDELVKEKRKKLLVYELDPSLINNDLKEYFESLTSISHAYVVKDPESTMNKGYGYVVFHQEQDLEEFCAKNLTLRLGTKYFKYSNLFHLPPKKKRETCMKTTSNNGESMYRSGKKRKGSQKAKGEKQSSEDVGDSISIKESENNSRSSSSQRFGEMMGGDVLKVPFADSPSAGKALNSTTNSEIISPKDHLLTVNAPESSLHTSNCKFYTEKGTGGTKTTRTSGLVQTLGGLHKEKEGLWAEVIRTSGRLNQRDSNYKFNRRPLPSFLPNHIATHYGLFQQPNRISFSN